MGWLQLLLPLLMFQPSCASPCAHSGSFSQSTHLLNGPNILYWEVHEIFKRYKKEKETVLFRRQTHYRCMIGVHQQMNAKIQPTFAEGHMSL